MNTTEQTDIKQISDAETAAVSVRKAQAALHSVIDDCFEDREPDTFAFRAFYDRFRLLLETVSDYLFVALKNLESKR